MHPRSTPSSPPGRARVNVLGHFLAGRGRFGGGSGSFSSFRQLKKKKVVNFFVEKSAAPDKILALPMPWFNILHIILSHFTSCLKLMISACELRII